MMTTIGLFNISIPSHKYLFFFNGDTLKFYSLSNFQVYNTVLFSVVMVCILDSQNILIPFGQTSPFLSPAPRPWYPPFHCVSLN